MSHRDTVSAVPPGFTVLGDTPTCSIAAMADAERRLYAVQFHPEVVHTPRGKDILEQLPLPHLRMRARLGCDAGRSRRWNSRFATRAGDRNVFFFVSGGVDSTVAYTLCLRALGPDRVHGTYVDTGLMREGETEFVRGVFARLGAKHFRVERAAVAFRGGAGGRVRSGAEAAHHRREVRGSAGAHHRSRPLAGRPLDSGTRHDLSRHHRIRRHGEGGSIKTHHNRVAGIQRLIESGRIVEPLSQFYKDEVREIGRDLEFPGSFWSGIRSLDRDWRSAACAEFDAPGELTATPDGWIVPVHSVGVQGDSRSYAPVLAIGDAAGRSGVCGLAGEPHCGSESRGCPRGRTWRDGCDAGSAVHLEHRAAGPAAPSGRDCAARIHSRAVLTSRSGSFRWC